MERNRFADDHFTYCPDCGRKGVYWINRLSRNESRDRRDAIGCKYCGWETGSDEYDASEKVERTAYLNINERRYGLDLTAWYY